MNAESGPLQGRVALVTGAGRGIGWAVARKLWSMGATVVLAARGEAELKARTAELGERSRALVLDVSQPETVSAVAGVAREFGRLDILVNNAGVVGLVAPLQEYPVEEWRRVMAVNIEGAFHCCKGAIPAMVERRWGRIVNVASIAGKEGNPRMAAYSASKAALMAMTKSLGKELAQVGVLVNCITPGVIATPFLEGMPKEQIDMLAAKMPIGRIGSPEEVAELVAWLSSDACSFATGAIFDCSGGRATY